MMYKKQTLWLLVIGMLCRPVEQVKAEVDHNKIELIDVIKVIPAQDNKIRFDDVLGHAEAKELSKLIIPAFKDTALYAATSKNIPKGIFLRGESGVGKKMLAQAFAGEASAPILQLSGESLCKLNPAQIHELFSKAKEMAPCVVIIDCLYDFIATNPKQNGNTPGVQAYLDEMDVLDVSNVPVMIFGTLSNPTKGEFNVGGLFDEKLFIKKPKFQDRVELLTRKFKDVKVSEDFDINIAARLMVGYSFDQVIKITQITQKYAASNASDVVAMNHFDRAFSFISNGAVEGFDAQSLEERYASAIHESGHAIITMMYDSQCALHNISLRQNNRSFGRVADIVISEPYDSTEEEKLYDITVGFGGGVAEQQFGLPEQRAIDNNNGIKDFMHRPSVGSDWKGLCEKAHEVVQARCEAAGGSCQQCAIINGEEMVKIIGPCYEKAVAIISANKDNVRKLAERALEKETIYANEAYAICGKKRPKFDFEKE